MTHEATQLSDDQRRTICRLLFLLLCALPTAIVVYFILHRPSPRDWERQIRAELGTLVKIDSVETPTPSLTMLRGVEILPTGDSGVRQNVFEGQKINELAIVFGNERNQVVIMDPIETDSAALKKMISDFTRNLGKSPDLDSQWQVRFKKVTLVDTESIQPDFVLQPVDVFIGSTEWQDDAGFTQQAVHFSVQAEAPDLDSGNKLLAQTWITKDTTFFSFDSGLGKVPIRVARGWQRQLDHLGSQCQFNGQVYFEYPNEEPSALKGSLVGNLSNIQLDRITGLPDSGLVGNCDLQNVSCSFNEGRIENVDLRVSSNGAISVDRSWIDVIRNFARSPIDPIAAPRISLPGMEFVLSIRNGLVNVSNAQQQLLHNIPVQTVAMALTGERSQGTRSIAIANLFNIPPAERIARHPPGDSIHH